MIYAVTVSIDIQTLDPRLPAQLMGRTRLEPGAIRAIPRGVLVFQAAAHSSTPGEPSLYRFVLQFGAVRSAGIVGNWLFSQLNGVAAALAIAGHPVPIDHHTIIASLKQVA